jgi:hypothetical protein
VHFGVVFVCYDEGMSKDFSERAKEIIAHITYINIASVTDSGLPWNSPVFAAYDDEYNFYFGTHKGSQKAKNIDANPNVFVTIYDSTIAPGDGEGVYIQAKAIRLSKPDEIGAAHAFLCQSTWCPTGRSRNLKSPRR